MEDRITLSNEQIDKLFDFARSKYVRQLDVQHEVVDHLASAIEDEMKADKNLSFESALSKVYSRFPVTGFASFVSAKEKGMRNYWSKIFWKVMFTYFTIPKLFFTLFVITVFGYLIYYVPYAQSVCFMCMLVYYYMTLFSISKRIKSLVGNKKDLLILSIFNEQLGVNVFTGPAFSLVLRDSLYLDQQYSIKYTIIYSIVLGIYFIWIHALKNEFVDKLEAEINQKYPYLRLT